MKKWTENERFASLIMCDLSTRCWLWIGAKYRVGNYWHASFWASKRGAVNAAKFFWERAHGRPMREGYETCHVRSCSSSLCVRPAHLYEGTRSDNMRDRQATGYSQPRDAAGRMWI